MRSSRAVASLFLTLVIVTACTGTAAIPTPSLKPATAATPAPTIAATPTPAPTVAATQTPTPTAASTPTASTRAPAPDFVACLVSQPGGIDDKGFNADSFKGMEDVKRARQIKTHFLESSSGHDFVNNIDTFAGQPCDIIVTVGYQLDDATAGGAAKYPNQKFTIVDFAYDTSDAAYLARVASDMGVSKEQVKTALDNNVLGLLFQTDESAMLAGYLAAGMSKTGKVGTFGGRDIPSVTTFMNGLAAGINYYNKQKGTTVRLLGWDAAQHTGTFIDDFEDTGKGNAASVDLIKQGADIIVPVAGPVGVGAAEAVHDAKDQGIMLIGVETDQSISTPQYGSVILTSILKRMDNAVQAAIDQAIDGTFKGGVYRGTLANEGVGLAPYHELASAVPATMTAEIDGLRAAIVHGSVKVADYLAPSH